MFSPKTVLPSTRRLSLQHVYQNAPFSSLKSTFPSNLTGNYNWTSSISCETPEALFSEKHDALIQKYKFSHSDIDAKKFHSEIIKNGFFADLFTSNTLINVYVRNRDMASANNVFAEMPEKNSVTWACLISGFTQNGMPRDAFAGLGRMVAAGFFPNHYAIGSALRSCQNLGSEGLKQGEQIHAFVSKSWYAFDVVVCNGLISMYGSCIMGSDGSDYAQRVFDEIAIKNSISWNSIISVYSQRGDVDSAFRLFSGMQKEGIRFSFKPTAYTFGSLVTVATKSPKVEEGSLLLKQLLAKIKMSGFLQDLYVGSALVSGFARVGSVDTAKSIFQHMDTRNAVSVNGLMVGLVMLKQGEEALEVFLETKHLVKLNIDTYVVLLSTFAEFSCLEDGKIKAKQLHAHLMRTGLNSSRIAIGNSLINVYSKFGAIEDACSVFKLMSDKDSVSWSSMVSGLDQNECFEDALSIFRSMKRNGLIPSNFTLISALSSCTSLGWIRMGDQTHCEAVKLGLNMDVSVSNTLLSLYADIGYITECKKLFSFMHEHDRVSWNSIISAFRDSEPFITKSTEYFIEMMRAGWSPNNITFTNILAAVSALPHVELTRQIHASALKNHVMDDTTVKNSFLTCYGKCGEMDTCEKIFSKMSEKDDVSWNSMISGYLHSERLAEAMNLVWLVLQNGQRLDCFTFATVLSACASVATLERGMEVHACATRACLVSDVVIGSALVDMYAKCGRIEYASHFFDLMPLRNVYSWNSMITGYARHGDGHKALKLFSQMKQENVVPDHVTFVGVLSACSHVGLVSQGFDHFESMSKNYSLTPRIEHFSCMVDLLGRTGEFGKLEDFIGKMPMRPNVLIWRTVLGACGRVNGPLLDIGKRAAEMIMELEPQNAVNYVLVANMYASGGKWERVLETRRVMKVAGVRKEAGCSWVNMKDGVHVFVSGDKSHPDIDAIYEKLGELHGRIKAAGYVPQIRFALYDVELENKEEALSYHSERLAVAFVLMVKSELPIRIMKNLRVCGDCHSVFNYISGIVGRQIVLRDSNRFHHFRDGKCSCNDFW